MRLTCPSCGVAYEVSPTLLAGRRAVRCARCGHVWTPPPVPSAASAPESFPTPPPAQAQTEEPPTVTVVVPKLAEEERPAHVAERPPVPAIPREPMLGRVRRVASAGKKATRGPIPLRVAWAASLLILIIALIAIIVLRGAVMHAWRPSARLYGAVGLQSTANGAQPDRTPHPPVTPARP
jgi:predicted Zn finger-like uncharacterized protein